MTKRQKEIQRTFFAKCGPNVAMLAKVFGSLPNIAFYIKDAEGRIVAINRYNCELCNIPSPDAAIGKRSSDLFPRAYADFCMARDREELAQFAAKDILKDLLPTVDNLALALDKAENKEDPFVQGVKLAYDGFLKVLADHGATPLDSVGEPFDTNFHDALAQLPSADVPEGTVMNEVKRGWLLHGKLLRPAQVVVSSGVPEKPAEKPAEEA
jgi:hypothetical protein